MQISSVQIKASPVTMQLLFESDEAIGIESLCTCRHYLKDWILDWIFRSCIGTDLRKRCLFVYKSRVIFLKFYNNAKRFHIFMNHNKNLHDL